VADVAVGLDLLAELPDGSEMDARIDALDWSATSLGPIDEWPRSLKTVVAVVLRSPFQMAIYWGPDLLCLYNDAERRVLGELHPRALGMPARELLSDSWSTVGPQLRAVMERGETTWAQDAPLTFNRWAAWNWATSSIPTARFRMTTATSAACCW